MGVGAAYLPDRAADCPMVQGAGCRLALVVGCPMVQAVGCRPVQAAGDPTARAAGCHMPPAHKAA